MTERRSTAPPAPAAADWDPHDFRVLADQRLAYDEMRSRCPVARDASGGWTIFRHADVVGVLHDHATFSNVVSSHVSVPNGMDPPAHTVYRQLIEPYFRADRVATFEPAGRAIAAALIDDACGQQDVEFMAAVALPCAARAQCAYLGWPMDLAHALIGWTQRNHEATLHGDRSALAAIAQEFETMVADLIASRNVSALDPPRDLTDALIREKIDGRRLTPEEVTSVFRNWTMGEVGTLAASLGILAHAVACDVELQRQLRRHLQLLPDAIDELLRMHNPLISSRRTVTRRVTIGGRTLEAGCRLTINWMAANRDPDVFDQPDRFRLDRNPGDNLLYGAGIHACPGAPLARLELRIVMEGLLAATHLVEPAPGLPATLAMPPASGYSTVPLRLIPAPA